MSVSILLSVGCVPYPVDKKICDEKCPQSISVHPVFRRWVISKINGAMTITQRYPSQVPEGKHKSQLFIIHVPIIISRFQINLAISIPSSGDHFFRFGTGICIEPMSHD